MACSFRANRHGYLAIRLYWQGIESHEGTQLRDTPANRAKVAARVRVINQEMDDGSFDYLRWFPQGHLAQRFRPATAQDATKLITVNGFFRAWGRTSGDTAPEAEATVRKQVRPVSVKWALNRASTIATNVLPFLGALRLDELTPAHVTDLQQRLLRRDLQPVTIDGVVHSALRGMLRDATAAGYRVVDLRTLYDRRFVRRLDQGSDPSTIDAFTEVERDRIIDGFKRKRPHYHAFVCHQFWTGARPSEAIGLRQRHLDLTGRRIRIRVSRVLGHDGRPKTGKSKRDIVIHQPLLEVLQARQPLQVAPDDFVFTTPSGVPINAANFYAREWLPMLRRLGIRPREFYNTRHSYISAMVALGVNPLFICRQTGTSLQMIEEHYGSTRTVADELDGMIAAAGPSRNPTGTLPDGGEDAESLPTVKLARKQAVRQRAGDRGRTGDVQLGKLAFYR